jgi:hypothetical protein
MGQPIFYPIGTGGSFLQVKRQRHEFDHIPPTTAEVKNMWIYSFTPLAAQLAASQEELSSMSE